MNHLTEAQIKALSDDDLLWHDRQLFDRMESISSPMASVDPREAELDELDSYKRLFEIEIAKRELY